MSAQLRGVQPEAVESRFKAFIYGKAGVGKTTFSLQFPAPYYIDGEDKTTSKAYMDLLKASGGVRFSTMEFEDLYKEVKTLATVKHGYKTLIIDPITYIYADLIDHASQKFHKEGKEDDNRRIYGYANKKMRSLMVLLSKIDMNVIMTAHQKDVTAKDGSILGATFDAYKRLDYMFDCVIEVVDRSDRRIGIIKKKSLGQFEGTKEFDFSYKELNRLSGNSLFDKEAEPIQLVSMDTITKIGKAMQMCNVSLVSYLEAYGVDEAKELSIEQAEEILEILRKRYKEQTSVNSN